MENNKPVILGGKPLFHEKLNIVCPVLPAYHSIASEIKEILETTRIVTKGKYLHELEEKAAHYLKVKNVMAVSSCTTGLMLTYHALKLSGDVICPSFTFMATISSLVWAGLKPIFVDVSADTTNLDNISLIEKALTPQTTAVVAVHTFGNPTNIEALESFCRRKNLKLIFDAAHGMGSFYRGVPIGGHGNAEVFSLSPTKLVIAGEGGLVATNDDELARKIKILREYGNSGNYDSEFAGFNARMPELSALLAIRSLDQLELNVETRNRSVKLFRKLLSEIPGLSFQKIDPQNQSSYKDLCLIIDPELFGMTRDQLTISLRAENIDTRHYYDPPLHRQTAYRHYSAKNYSLTNTEKLAKNSLCIPLYSQMEDLTVEKICAVISRIKSHAALIHEFITSHL